MRRFLRDARAGATGFMAAVAAVMALGGTALISDHAWLVNKRDILKSAAVAATLAATFELRKLPASMSDEDVRGRLQPIAKRYVRFNLLENLPPGARARAKETLEVELTLDRSAGLVGVTAQADMGDTLFAKWLYGYAGPSEMKQGAGAERDVTMSEVVLVIDVTGSMVENLDGDRPGAGEESRMEIVKRSALALVGILDPGGAGSSAAIGLVPWHINVRLDAAMRAAWERDGWVTYPTERTYPIPYSGAPSDSSEAETWPLPAKPAPWDGCVDQRSLTPANPPGLSTALPADSGFTMAFYPVRLYTSLRCLDTSPFPSGFRSQNCYVGPLHNHLCPSTNPTCQRTQNIQPACSDTIGMQPILPLTTDAEKVRNAVNGLKPVGPATYSTIGLVWGQRLLAHQWQAVWGDSVHPVDSAKEEYLGVRKALVLLTDGEDNFAYGDIGVDRDAACTAVKNAGIEIFTVAAMNPARVGSRLERALTDCSSQADHPDGSYVFINNENPQDLEEAFRSIGRQLLVVRRTY